MFPLQPQICFILLYNQVIKRNNQIIRTNNQIFKILIVYIRPRLADVGSNYELYKLKEQISLLPLQTFHSYWLSGTNLLGSMNWKPTLRKCSKTMKYILINV